MNNETIFYLIGWVLGALVGGCVVRVLIKPITVIEVHVNTEDMHDSEQES